MRRNKQTSGERIVKDIKRKTRKQCPSSYKVALISARAKRDFAHLFG